MNRVVYHFIAFWLIIQCSLQQDTSDDGNDDDDSCSYIFGQNCNNDGICKYCAMCLQSSCILSKTIGTPVCNTTQFGTTNTYDWYGYCLSSGNDNSGGYCATSTECYQYRRNSNASTSNIWQSLTCNPTSCLLITDNGQPAPMPGALPPNDNPSASNPTTAHPVSPHEQTEEHNPTAIALSVTCTLIFVGILVWLFKLWKQSSYWIPPFFKRLMPGSSSTPSSAPPSFRSTSGPEMTSTTPTGISDGIQHQHRLTSSSRTSSHSYSNRERGEPLPSYFSPEPSPPKYEHAIVTQIRGLLEDSNYQYQASTSSSMNVDHHHGYSSNEDSMAMDHYNNEFPPPMWVPIYFAPNHTSFSLGRLRRHPHPSSNRDHDQEDSSATSEQDLGSSSMVATLSTTTSA